MLYYLVYLVVFATVAYGSTYSGPGARCSAQEFTCADGACVTRESRCDGAQHCADNSDEQDCGPGSKSDFRCRDGACISFDKKCDGVADCPDESDETLALCRNMRCSPHLFRCSYGACVDGTAPCNNVTDCADNSDELMPKCRSEKRELRGLFTCKNGETIPSTKLCDGKADCIDSSDESLDSCAGKRCVSYYFQCAYGACVDNGAACNGKDECFDGSDESDELCNRTTSTTCVLPKYPANGAYSVIGLPQARPGQRYKFIHLEVTCDPGFILVGDPVNFCYGANQWIRAMPKCSRACKLTPDPSVTYACKLTGAGVLSGTQTCREYEPDGTIVVPTCNSPNYYYDGYLSNMICKEGSWDHVATCNPECGTTTPKGVPKVLDGTPAVHGELPWHAGIYDKGFRPYKQICGGSLVSRTIVVSAAHCFWGDGVKLPASKYAVALAKINRPWTDPNDVDVHKSDVLEIKIPPRYMGDSGNLQEDIALVFMATPAVFTVFIRPVCLDFDLKFDRDQLKDTNKGKVAGWGINAVDGHPSPVLLTAELPYVEVAKCFQELPFDFKPYVTSDKICAGEINGTSLCQGDSGGGLAFPSVDIKGIRRYFLRGVGSAGPSSEHKCTPSYTTFTHVLKHEGFFSDALFSDVYERHGIM